MFLEIPDITKTKSKQVFDIIKNSLNSKKASYYPISNNIIYAFKDKNERNLSMAKLVKNIYKLEDNKNFIVLSLHKNGSKKNEEKVLPMEEDDNGNEKSNIKENDDLLEVFIQKENGSIKTFSYIPEIGSFISIIMNNQNKNENLKIYYIIDETIENLIEQISIITGTSKDIFQPVEIEFTKEDYSNIVNEISFKEQFEKYKNDLLKNLNKKDSNGKVEKSESQTGVIIAAVIFFICIGGYYGYDYYQTYQREKRERIELEKSQKLRKEKILRAQKLAEAKAEKERTDKIRAEKARIAKLKEENTKKILKNLETYELINRLINNEYIGNFQIFNDKIDVETFVNKDFDPKEYFTYNNMAMIKGKLYIQNADLFQSLIKLKKKELINNFIKNEILDEIKKTNDIDIDINYPEVIKNLNGDLIMKNGDISISLYDVNIKDIQPLFKTNKQYNITIFKTNNKKYQINIESIIPKAPVIDPNDKTSKNKKEVKTRL